MVPHMHKEMNRTEPSSQNIQCPCRYFSCAPRCNRLLDWIQDTRPDVPPKDPETRIWYERGKCSRFDLLFPFLTALLSLLDTGMDVEVAVTHYRRGDYSWGVLTLAFAFVSLVSIGIVSANWYLEDQKSYKREILKKNGLEIKKWHYLCHFFLCGGLLRCCQIFRTVRLIRSIKHQSPDDKERYRLYIAQLQDSSTLGVLEAFMEEAPQVALQLYILLRRGSLDLASFEDLIVALSIPKSLALFAFNLLIYARYIRVADEESRQLNWCSAGSLLYFLWRLFMLTSRILALAVFASHFTRFVFIVVAIHFAASYALLWRQECEYFEDEPVKQKFFRFAIAYVHMFCFFPLEGKNTRKWGYPYYILNLIEDTVMVLLWNFLTSYDLKFRIVILTTEWGTFLIGIVSLVLFYRCFHPSLNTAEMRQDEIDLGRKTNVKTQYKRARWKVNSNGNSSTAMAVRTINFSTVSYV
ncbi:XK-related protein 6-like [Oculina patagonica]